MEILEMPEKYESTDEMMAEQGIWIEASEALDILEKLLSHIQSNKIRFGLIKNSHDEIVEELQSSIKFAQNSAETGAKLNFAIVM